MNKKGILALVVLTLIIVMCFAVMGCDQIPQDTEPKEYTIQYTHDANTYKITVKDGEPYTLDVVPSKEGYQFMGLFDAEVGGTQYVSANGASLAPFNEGKHMVLFPQFKAKDYTVILDYQGASITGNRQFVVAYDNSLPELPKNLTVEHKTFSGWYTKANCEGVKIADEYGLIPVVSVLNNKNFDLSGEYIYLYAGFDTEKFTVTCIFEEGMDSEELQVEYDTQVSQIVTQTRVDGKAPLTWSKTQGGEVFNGKITDDVVLYAVEYAPVINLDVNGGSKVQSIVARAGSSISLPTPTKDLAKFAYWEDMQGNIFNSTTMPSSSISLKAIWQGKLVFDSNGGSDVKEISEKAGASISLPTPEREGFIFAGWYTAEKEQYTSQKMPVEGVKLKAGWYKAKTVKKDFLSGEKTSSIICDKVPTLKSLYDIDFTELASEIDWSESILVRIEFHADFKHSAESKVQDKLYPTKEHFYYYSQPIVNDAYLIEHLIVDHGKGTVNTSYTTTHFSTQITVTGGKIFAALGADKKVSDIYSGTDCGWQMTNFWCSIYYPDTTNLYL